MASPSSESTGIPIWFVVWGLVVAAIWLTPTPLVDRFVVGPLLLDSLSPALSEHNVSESQAASIHRLNVLAMRILASVFAALYPVARALTARWRHPEEA